MKLRKDHPQKIKEKYTCCAMWPFCPERKWFSIAKIFQKVMQYFCLGRCPRVQRIFVNLFKILGARKLGVALEHTPLKWFSGKKLNIFLLWKIFLGLLLEFFLEKERWARGGWVTWVKIKGRPKWSSPFELIQNPKSKANAKESPENERRQIQMNLVPLR